MRKKTLIILISFWLISQSLVYAQEETLPSPTQSVVDKIQELKDRVASRVASLKREKLTAVNGLVKKVAESALILLDQETEYSIQTDEETQIYSVDEQLRQKEIKLTNLSENQNLTVIGLVNPEDKNIEAKLIVTRKPNLTIVGRVGSVSTKDGTITVIDNDGTTYLVDIEITTKSYQYDLNQATTSKIGLSKIKEGAKIHVYAVAGAEENRVTAIRVLILPSQIPYPFNFPLASLTPTPTLKE